MSLFISSLLFTNAVFLLILNKPRFYSTLCVNLDPEVEAIILEVLTVVSCVVVKVRVGDVALIAMQNHLMLAPR